MTNQLATFKSILAGAVIGSVISVIAYISLFQPAEITQNQNPASAEKEPLYWVAPMDPNYKRDKPGKSPMGMDLIPVYEDGGNGPDTGPGTIKISPEVMNNLGVRTAVAEVSQLHSEIKTVGYVQYDEDKLVHIHPRVEGWIERLYVKAAGDPVKKGQPLYEIYSPELVNAQEEFVLALDRKNPRLLQAAEERLKALRLPEDTINALKKTRNVKQAITIFAPQSGVVDNLNIREGFFVKPGTTLMSVGTLDQVWVEAEIFERQASQVKEALPVTMSLDYLPGKEWRGTVDYIYPTLDAKTRTLKVRLRFDNQNDELKPNMFAQVVIHAETAEESLLVPKEAVIRSGSFDRLVLALDNGRYKSVKVKIGRVDDQFAEILSGVKAGESVVASAQFLLDSESSKTSDFKRMNHESDDNAGQSFAPNSIWVEAKINNLMAGHRMINVSHHAIEEWQWPEMTMDFSVAESVNFADLKQGMTLHIEITKNADDQYLVSNIHIPSGRESGQKSGQGQQIDHENMDHSKPQDMSHDTMDHGKHNQ
ncbi:efflux RND transporter periplasmic adaptor subunit [Paremcibacter congregatus]|uniref:efflux RND transporter periplasmic adaptor subunit n=1 Tax=Paremcibacter congregatus TaxID=2043170 RepID=UPI0030EE16D1|tara:strand:+ start:3853 stop:5463 length:1611 start_codon:yes stop_codon:yes gene_type:complete